MKKRDFKAFFKDISKMNTHSMGKKEKRVDSNDTGKLKLPYKMLMGMQKKSIERKESREKEDKDARIIGGSGRGNKLMQNYFEKKDVDKREEKRLRLDTSNRGDNLHQLSLGKFKNGSLHFSKEALERMEKGDLLGGAYKKHGDLTAREKRENEQIKIGKDIREKKPKTYVGIMSDREKNPEYMTGRRFAKPKGAMGKLHKKGTKSKKKFKSKKH